MAHDYNANDRKLSVDLAFAVVSSSDMPMLLLDGEARIISASRSFCAAFGTDPDQVIGRHLKDLGHGEWNSPQLHSLLSATAHGFAEIGGYEMRFAHPDGAERCLVVKAHKLDYPDSGNIRVVLSVLDITQARKDAKRNEELVRDKSMLLEELQHRVANSLQIIASVLMQSARRVQSDETRTHLYDAHNRIMSVAALQRQLALSHHGNVLLRTYLTDLCQSLGASMIRDRENLTLTVKADESVVESDISISLGLVVTELVINALKHAFPNQRAGKIVVDYHMIQSGWILSVTDNGIGMPIDVSDAKAGLGTSIVKALAVQLDAQIAVNDAHPGTMVQLLHANKNGPPLKNDAV